METLSPWEIISKLISKIQNDWERANKQASRMSRIDKDILMDDLKKVYDLVYDLDIARAHSDLQSIKKSPEKVVVTNDEQQSMPDFPPEINVDQPMDDEHIPAEGQPEEQKFESIIEAGESDDLHEEEEEPVLRQAEVEFEIEGPVQEEKVGLPREGQVLEPDGPTAETDPYAQPETKTTLDLFSASKTLADVYQDDTDNSLAAKIQQNKISDIKTAIGINDKFLFINDIFRGEMSAYNQTIEKLNQTTGFHEALQIIDELKLANGTEENKATFNKLVEVAKRRSL
jgi:hypothetical protein